MGERLEQAIAVLNGLVGDYLERQDNGLATDMAFHDAGHALELSAAGIQRAHPRPTGRAAVFVHGVMCTESVWHFPGAAADASDYGRMLQRDLGITPFYVRYNSGRSIADNGAALATLLDALHAAYPLELQELIPIGYSMGGLLVRSACHVAAARELSWLPRLKRAIYVGTPHVGAPAERVGRIVSRLLHAIPAPYTRLVGDIAELRSAGVKDLGDADLRHGDRAADSGRLSLRDRRHPVPLLSGIDHALVAGSLSMDPRVAALFGDSIVPLRSATAQQTITPGAIDLPDDRIAVFPGRNHLDLAHDAEVYAFIKRHCEQTS